jgi:hypothetical protein
LSRARCAPFFVTTGLDPVVHAEAPHGLPIKSGNDGMEDRSRDAVCTRVIVTRSK